MGHGWTQIHTDKMPRHRIAWIRADGSVVALRNGYGCDGKAPGVQGTLRFLPFRWAFGLATTFMSCTPAILPHCIHYRNRITLVKIRRNLTLPLPHLWIRRLTLLGLSLAVLAPAQ